MPSKGAYRVHETIRLTPTGHSAVSDVLPADQVVTVDPAQASWTDAGAVGGVEDPIVPPTEDGTGETESDPDDDSDESTRTPIRRYEGDATSVEMTNITGARADAHDQGGIETPVEVTLPDGSVVSGVVGITNGGRRFTADGSRLSCDCGQVPCGHTSDATEAVEALMNGRRIRSAVSSWEQRRLAVNDRLADAYRETLTGQLLDRSPDGPSWAEDPTGFQAAYSEGLARRRAGESPVDYLTDNATGGLGHQHAGRSFGVELEFDLDQLPVSDRAAAIDRIGRDLHEAGLTRSATQQGYHANQRSGYSSWTFERDSTVAGEVVSPILDDSPESWRQLEEACDIIRRHGGTASARTGSHVHVSCGDYGHDVSNHNNLLNLTSQYEDVLFRLAQNPSRSSHRGTSWCSPNRVPAEGYESVGRVRSTQGNHGSAINFGSVAGRQSDHVEFRMWDGSLDPGVIQSQVKVSLGLTEAARRQSRSGTREPLGTHRSTNSHLQRGQRLQGEAWSRDTSSFRNLMDTLFHRDQDKRQVTQLFGATRWQRR